MTKSNSCPDDDTLTLFLEESGSDGNVAMHIRTCDRCQERLDEICHDGELETWAKSGESSTPSGDKLEYSLLMQRLAAIALMQPHKHPSESTPHDEGIASFREIDHYQIIRNLGSGGMSIVYEAVDRRLNRSVAIKVLRSRDAQELSVARFAREASAIANIHHPNVVTIHQIETESSIQIPYLVMELVSGPSLHAWLAEHKSVEPRQASVWIAEIADGLAAAHAAGIIHRDIKPSNILLSPKTKGVAIGQKNQAGFIAKLADFGLAQTDNVDSQLTQTGVLTGTPAYVSPEQLIDNSTSVQSDIYSLGITFFQILTGELPFRGSPHAVLKQIAEEEIPSLRKLNPVVPADLETICLKATSHSASQRYDTATEFAEDLRRWLRGEAIRARQTTSIERANRWVRRNRRVATLLATIGFLLMAIAAVSIWSSVVLTRARNALADQFTTAIEAKREAERASAQANAQSQVAEEQKRIAIEQRTIAVDSINTLLEEVQQKLDFNAGALRLREQLIKTALKGLAKIAESGDASSLERPTMSAYFQLANVQRLLGKSDEAKKTTDEAYAFAEVALQKNENDAVSLSNMGMAKCLRGDLSQMTFGTDAKKWFQEAVDLMERAKSLNPDDKNNTRHWISCRAKIGDIDFNAGKYQEAKQWFEPALADIAELSKREPNMTALIRDHCVLLRRQAQTLSVLQEPGARELLSQAVQLAELGREREPDNPIYRSDLAYLLGSLSGLDCNEGRFQEAIEHANQSTEQFEAVAALDPSNTQHQVNLSATYDYLSKIYLAANDLDNANRTAKKACDTSSKLVQSYPKTSRFRLMLSESVRRVSDILARQMKYVEAVEIGHQAVKIMDEASLQQDANANTIGLIRYFYQLQVDAIQIVALREELPETKLDPMLLAGTWAINHAQNERWESVWDAATQVRDTLQSWQKKVEMTPENSYEGVQYVYALINAARGAGISYQYLTEHPIQLAEEKPFHNPEKLKELALQLIKKAIELDSSVRLNMHMEPDIAFLKNAL